MVQHVAKVKNMAQQLRDLGSAVDNTTVMAKILASFSPKYSAFPTVWENMDENRQTVDNLTERLIREEARFESADGVAEALAVTKISENNVKEDGNKNRRPKKPFDPQNVTCYKCKEKGHLARTCPSRKKNGGERDESKSRDYAFVVSSKVSQGRLKVRDKSDEPFCEIIDKVLAADNTEAWLTDSGQRCVEAHLI